MEAFMDWKERFRDELWVEPEPVPTCGDCIHCAKPEKAFTTDARIAWCIDVGDFCHTDWISDDCESFLPR